MANESGHPASDTEDGVTQQRSPLCPRRHERLMITPRDPVAALAALVECSDLPIDERLRLIDWLLEEHPAAIHNAHVRVIAESLLEEAGWQRLPTAVCAQEPSVHGDRQLECIECGCRSEPGATSWRAYLSDDDQAVTFCPTCAELGEAL
jgi:hypothetical protein